MKLIKKLISEVCSCDIGCLPYSECECINPSLEARIGFTPGSVIIGTIPYYTHHCNNERTVSAYAVAYDYHLYLSNIGKTIIEKLQAAFPDSKFAFFGDHSPINEKHAAAKAGLGIIGKNGLLITPKHSSYVFLFEIISDMECSEAPQKIELCENCGQCIKACPSFLKGCGECLSSITQKKGELSEDDKHMIMSNGSAWGCDICQEVCPHTKTAKSNGTIYTNIPWFNYNIILSPTQESIEDYDDFSKRAYSWRGEKTIKRNLEILNQAKNNEK